MSEESEPVGELDNRIRIKSESIEVEVESKEKNLMHCLAIAEGLMCSFVEKDGHIYYEKGLGFKGK